MVAAYVKDIFVYLAERELPVVWAVAKGSFRYKCLLVPAALAISLVAPWLITPLLMLGGLRTGRQVVDYIENTRDVVLVALDYPYAGNKGDQSIREFLPRVPAR